MQTVEVAIPVEADHQEVLIAELEDFDFEAFDQEDRVLKAYIPAARWNDVTREWIEQWLVRQGIQVPLRESVIEPTNWNAQWEETVRPVAVPPFIIKPTWADLPPEHADKILLEVDPKMSFGTGYHESTRLMLRLLPRAVTEGDTVLDAGTGTGILAIAAVRIGAARCIAFDIDEWSQPNARENVLLNRVADRVDVRLGGIEVVPEAGFDVILANINLNVLLGLLDAFRTRLNPDGRLIMAGMLRSDGDRMREALGGAGFTVRQEMEEGDWWAVSSVRTP